MQQLVITVMVATGFYYTWYACMGNQGVSHEFSFSPQTVLAFGALGSLAITIGQGNATVGIMEATIGNVTENTMTGEYPVPVFVGNNVRGITFYFGSHTPGSPNTIFYLSASMNVILWG